MNSPFYEGVIQWWPVKKDQT